MLANCPECEEFVKVIHSMQQDRLEISKRLTALRDAETVWAVKLDFKIAQCLTEIAQLKLLTNPQAIDRLHELENERDCKSGTAICDLHVAHGYPCYRHLYEAQWSGQSDKYRVALEQIALGQYTAQGCKDISNAALGL